MKKFLAIDLGATSGRTVIGTLDNGKISLKELTRFPNSMSEIDGHLYWDIHKLMEHVKGLILQNQSCRIFLTRGNNKISERRPGKNPVLVV